MLTSKTYKLTRDKTGALLHRFEASAEEAVSIYLPSGMTTDEVTAFLRSTPKTQSIPYDAVRLAATSPTGSVLYWGTMQKCIILPPFPLREKYITNGYETEPLLSLISKDYTIGIVLVRFGARSPAPGWFFRSPFPAAAQRPDASFSGKGQHTPAGATGTLCPDIGLLHLRRR
jgi:hypothetical protein